MEGAAAVVLATPTPSSSTTLSRQQKILLMTAAVGVTAVGLIARYFRRPTRPGRNNKDLPPPPLIKGGGADNGGGGDFTRYESLGGGGGGSNASTVSTMLNSPSPRGLRQGGQFGERSSIASSILTQTTLVSNSIIEGGGLTGTQLGILGMETLEKSISFWDESLHLLRQDRMQGLGEEEENLCTKTIHQLEEILQEAKHLQHLAEELYLDEGSALYAESDGASYGRLRSASSVESFMSAEDFLSDDEDIRHSLESAGFLPGESADGVYPLYEAALRLVEVNTVPYRSLKTEMVGCIHGDQEYLAKLHCLRGAFSRIISDGDKRRWIIIKGKEVFSQILMKNDKHPSDFERTYDDIINWSHDTGNWGLIENELKDRGLRALTFYDIVLDYIFLDAFEDLDSPPASVLAVTQNRWLSSGFKETALGTAVWSVLKTKRKWLRHQEGFMSHFYTLSEHIMPTLAWGFLGPHNNIQNLCFFFKDKFLEFLNSIFSFEGVRYTTLDDLADDVMKKLELMYSLIVVKIDETPSPPPRD